MSDPVTDAITPTGGGGGGGGGGAGEGGGGAGAGAGGGAVADADATAGAVGAGAGRAPPETDASVLQLGRSPWMRKRAGAAPVVAPAARVPSATDDARVALRAKDVKTIQQKEQESGARKEALVEEQKKAQHMSDRYQENLRRCRWYFFVGCFGLPLLHFVSVFYFARELKGQEGDFKIKRYLYLSLIVAIVETFLWILWIVVFQLLRDTQLIQLNILHANVTSLSLI